MNKNRKAENVACLLSLSAFTYCIMLVSCGKASAQGISEAVSRCLNVIIPSLFAFTAVSGYVISSGLGYYISKPFSLLSRYVMKLPSELFFVFLAGNCAGYPVGTKLLADMVRSGSVSKKTASSVACFCCCGGPAYFMGTVGFAVFGNSTAGLCVFLSVVTSDFLLSVIVCRITKPHMNEENHKLNLSSQVFTDSVVGAGNSMLTICSMILFFSSVMAVLGEVIGKFFSSQNSNSNLIVIVKSMLEISNVSCLQGSPFNLLPCVAAVCAFGGLCVVVQCVAVNGGAFSMKPYLFTRPVVMAFSYVFCRLYMYLLLPDSVCVSTAPCHVFVKVNNFLPSICLIMMILLLNFKKRVAISKRVCYNK